MAMAAACFSRSLSAPAFFAAAVNSLISLWSLRFSCFLAADADDEDDFADPFSSPYFVWLSDLLFCHSPVFTTLDGGIGAVYDPQEVTLQAENTGKFPGESISFVSARIVKDTELITCRSTGTNSFGKFWPKLL